MAHPIRVCMISESFLPTIGGLQFEVKYLLEALAKQDAEIVFVSRCDGEKFLEKPKGRREFILMREKGILSSMLEIYRIIKRAQPDVIHVHSAEIDALQLAALKLFRLIKHPIVVTSHGVDIMIQKEVGYGFRLRWFNRITIKFTLSKMTKHAIDGISMKDFAREAGSKPENVVLVNNGVPLERLDLSPERIEEVARKYGIVKEDRVLLSLSGMRPLKGLEYAVCAMPKILEKVPNVKLVMACSNNTEYEQGIRKLVEDLGIAKHVSFIGFVADEEEKIALLRRCDILCKPSRLEACSVAILEAMREGSVVVASVPGGIDIITNGRNGFLAKDKDPEDFANTCINVLTNDPLKAEIGKNAAEDIKDFDIMKTTEKYIALYKSMAGK